MKVWLSFAVAFGCLGAVALGAGDVKWIGQYNWAAVTKLGATLTFPCTLLNNTMENSTSTWPILGQEADVALNYSSVNWTLPSGASNDAESKAVNMSDGSLTVSKVADTDHGIYLCSVYTDCTGKENCTSTQLWFKHGLNLNGPVYLDLIEKYKQNLINGAASAGGVLGFFLLACLIYKFRYKDDVDNFQDADVYSGTKISDAYRRKEDEANADATTSL